MLHSQFCHLGTHHDCWEHNRGIIWCDHTSISFLEPLGESLFFAFFLCVYKSVLTILVEQRFSNVSSRIKQTLVLGVALC